jgi:hypothetical protein
VKVKFELTPKIPLAGDKWILYLRGYQNLKVV